MVAAGDVAVNGFRAPQVCGIIGITYRQLDYWARIGLLRPSIRDAQGSGTQRVYSYANLLQLQVIRRLLDVGVSLGAAHKAVECLRGPDGRAPDVDTRLVISDGGSVLIRSEQELSSLLRESSDVLLIVLDIGKVILEVDAAVAAARQAKQV